MNTGTADRITGLLDRHGWAQAHPGRVWKAGRICLGMAMAGALGGDMQQMVAPGLDALATEVGDVIKGMFPERVPAPNPAQNTLTPVVAFNDHTDTTRDDVALVIKHCVGE